MLFRSVRSTTCWHRRPAGHTDVRRCERAVLRPLPQRPPDHVVDAGDRLASAPMANQHRIALGTTMERNELLPRLVRNDASAIPLWIQHPVVSQFEIGSLFMTENASLSVFGVKHKVHFEIASTQHIVDAKELCS